MEHGAGPFTCTANGSHTRQLIPEWFHHCLTWLPVTLTGVSCDAQDHNVLCIRTSSQLSTRRKKPLDTAALLLLTDRVRACVCIVLRARSVWTRKSSVAFTKNRARPVGIGMARSFTKSEYAQCLVLVSRSLFDIDIEW